jgi:hypothetical protein
MYRSLVEDVFRLRRWIADRERTMQSTPPAEQGSRKRGTDGALHACGHATRHKD